MVYGSLCWNWQVSSESVATLPPFSPIEGQKWFDQISSQWESQKNRFALIYFGEIQLLPPCVWNLPFMSTASVVSYSPPLQRERGAVGKMSPIGWAHFYLSANFQNSKKGKGRIQRRGECWPYVFKYCRHFMEHWQPMPVQTLTHRYRWLWLP